MADTLNKLNAANYIAVKVTDNPIANGNNLLAAYNLAKSTNPNGLAKSATNRVNIILPVAIYDLGTQSLTLDAQFINIIGSTNNRDNHYIKSNVGVTNRGTIIQTANNVILQNLTIENTNTTYSPNGTSSDAVAYSPSANLNLTYIENVRFLANDINVFSMRTHDIEYSGTYINCIGGIYAFGGGQGDGLFNKKNGILSGIFTNCTGGNFSFGGGFFLGNGGTLTGTFTNCTGGNYSFGSGQFQVDLVTGTFINCTGGNWSFGSVPSSSSSGTVTATFIDCIGGEYSFGNVGLTGTSINYSLTIQNCIGGQGSFGGA